MAVSLDTLLRKTRRRLVAGRLLNHLLVGWGAACLTAAIWVQVQPFAWEDAPAESRWWFFAGLMALATAVCCFRVFRRNPTDTQTALLIDERYGLRERMTTALSLNPEDKATAPGQAMMADAADQLKVLKLRDKFPVSADRRRVAFQVGSAALAAAALLTQPLFGPAQAGSPEAKAAEIAKKEKEAEKIPEQPKKKFLAQQTDNKRDKKSEQLEKLESELAKLYNDPEAKKDKMPPEKAREAFEKAGDLREKLKRLETEKFEQVKRMQEQLQKLTEMQQKQFDDGPAKEASQAIKTGDFEKAKEEFDKLAKKIQNKELSEDDALKLKRQIEEMSKKADELAKKKDAEKKLEKMIDEAKKAGKNTESLERELKKMQEEAEKLGGMKELAKKLNEMKQAMDKNDISEMAEKMKELADQFGDLSEQVKDLEDLDEHMEDLKNFRKQLAGKGKKDGEGENEEIPEVDDAEEGSGRAAGRRKINENAKSSSEDQRVRTAFDPKGRKRFGGSTDGPAFTKKSIVELEGEIEQAAQDVGDGMDIQKLPKAAQDAVKEYFQRLGNQGKAKPTKE